MDTISKDNQKDTMTLDELADLKNKLKSLRENRKNEAEVLRTRNEINELERELGLPETRFLTKERNISGNFLKRSTGQLKDWLIEIEEWKTFKLLVLGIVFFYGSVYIKALSYTQYFYGSDGKTVLSQVVNPEYLTYGAYMELLAIILVIIALYISPHIQKLWRKV